MEPRHVSFDVWNTLITANPEFAQARTELLAKMYGVTEQFAKAGYTRVKKMFDDPKRNVTTAAPSTDQVFSRLIAEMGGTPNNTNIALLRSKVEDLFHAHPPTISDDAIGTIAWLRMKGVSISIASNTNFISGDVMLPFLESTLGQFDFALFSDKIGWAKPHFEFFNLIINKTYDLGISNAMKALLHIGDDPNSDVFMMTDNTSTGQHALINGPHELSIAVRSRFATR